MLQWNLIKRKDSQMSEPAFPIQGFSTRDGQGLQLVMAIGMTLRDYFAAKAMQGMNARDTYDAGQASPEQRAKLAYIEADAMMRARAQ